VQFGEKTVPQIAIASHFIILIFHHQNCEKMGSTHVNPSSLPKQCQGGVKAEDPKSCVGATEIRKKSVPNSNGPVEIVLSIGIQRAITGPEILQT